MEYAKSEKDMRKQGEALGLFGSYMALYKELRAFEGKTDARLAVGGFGRFYPAALGFIVERGRLYPTVFEIDVRAMVREIPEGTTGDIRLHQRCQNEDSVPYEGCPQVADRIFLSRYNRGFAIASGPLPLDARRTAMGAAYGAALALWMTTCGGDGTHPIEEGKLLFVSDEHPNPS